MRTRIGFLAATVAASLLSGGSALAVGVTLDNISAALSDATPAGITITNDAGGGTSTARWGTSTGFGQSGYNFTPRAPQPAGPFAFGSTFMLGEFAHVNFPIQGTFLDTINPTTTYDATLDDGMNTVSATELTSVFSFKHFETPNEANPCAAGDIAPCPDLVTVLDNVGTNSTIELSGVMYQLFVTGFDLGGGNTFLTLENQTNTAKLFATISDQPPTSVVPVPAALPLLMSALGVFGLMSRRRKAA